MLSQGRLNAGISFYGVGAFTNKELKANDIAMEINGNFTLSTYDSYFPHIDKILDVLREHLKNQLTTASDINLIRMILNLNWKRYVDKSNRFFRIYFDNLPKYKDSLLFWDEQEKKALKKLINDPLIEKDLLLANNTSRDFLIEDIRKVLKKINPDLPHLLLEDWKVEEAMDIIYSRSFPISLKGWKIIHNLTNEIEDDDIQDIGYVLVPGADAINYEKLAVEHVDLQKSQVKYENGKVVVKAGRKFKIGEEFTINYNPAESVYGLFRRYGFVPIESLYNNMIFREDYINMEGAPRAGRLICLALGACIGSEIDTTFKVPKFTNKFDLAHSTFTTLLSHINTRI